MLIVGGQVYMVVQRVSIINGCGSEGPVSLSEGCLGIFGAQSVNLTCCA